MNDMSDLPPRDHNGPPLVDPEILAQSRAKVEDFTRKASDWLQVGEITSAEQAGDLADYISGARSVWKRIDEARSTAKKPHDDASKSVQGMFTPLLDAITRSVDKLKPLQAAWLRKEQKRLDDEREAKRREADILRQQAEEAAALAAANNSVTGELEAERLQKEADAMARSASREVKANVQSASGGGRTMAIRKTKKARITDINNAYRHYRDRAELAELLIGFAERDIRAKGWDGVDPPGFETYEVDGVA
jgi:hypothetical protein